jgi:general secretion pathway protein K
VNNGRRQAGIALIAVLWVVSGLSIIVAAVLAQTRTEARLTRTHVDLARARAMSEAGVYRGLYELLRARESVRYGLPDDMPRLEWGTATVTIRIDNEAGKIDVNHAPELLLQNLFVQAGVGEAQARQLASRTERLRRYSGTTAYGQDEEDTFASIEDFAAQLDLSARSWRRMSSWITVHNGRAGINPYVAHKEVLSMLPGFDPAVLENLLQEGSPHRLQSRLERIEQVYLTDRLSPVYTVSASATIDGVSTTVAATIKMSAHRSRPYHILTWSEEPGFQGG